MVLGGPHLDPHLKRITVEVVPKLNLGTSDPESPHWSMLSPCTLYQWFWLGGYPELSGSRLACTLWYLTTQSCIRDCQVVETVG